MLRTRDQLQYFTTRIPVLLVWNKSTSDVGAGLGLAIAADLVARNGGAITLAPVKADDFYCGARFLIKIPTAEGAARKPARARSDARELLP